MRELKRQLLNYLADDWDKNGPCVLKSEDIANKLGVSFEEIRPLIRSFHVQRIIETCVGEGSINLTPEGYKIARPDDPSNPFYGRNQVVINAPIQGSAIAFDGSQARTINLSKNFLEKLEKEIENHPDISVEDKRRWLPTIIEMAKHPLVLKIIEWIKPI
jgi:hypothetical protein